VIDVGANLTHAAFRADLDEVVARARDAGVAPIVVTGTTVAESRAAQEVADKYGFYATAGVHPHHARDCSPATISELRGIASHPRVVAIGECGLDFNRNYSPRPDQEKCFVAQLELGIELDRPLFLHSRNAHPRLAEILEHHEVKKAVAHCFTGGKEELRAYLDWVSTSASPAGSATSGAAGICSSWCARSPPTGCFSRPTRRTSRRAISGPSPEVGATSLLFAAHRANCCPRGRPPRGRSGGRDLPQCSTLFAIDESGPSSAAKRPPAA